MYFILLQHCTKQFLKFYTILLTVNFHVRGWEMSKTQREWITQAAVPLQRSYGVIAVSQKYKKILKIRDGYVIAARLKLTRWFWSRRWKCKKFTIITTTTDKFRSEKLTQAYVSGELKHGPVLLLLFKIYFHKILISHYICKFPIE